MKQMQQLRSRMQITASKVDNSQRLGHRLTNALAQLLSQKTVSGILHTCATIGTSLFSFEI
jgi:abnormal spindle-like microcephaly-associated protein